jgi:hypothetical protein
MEFYIPLLLTTGAIEYQDTGQRAERNILESERNDVAGD